MQRSDRAVTAVSQLRRGWQKNSTSEEGPAVAGFAGDARDATEHTTSRFPRLSLGRRRLRFLLISVHDRTGRVRSIF